MNYCYQNHNSAFKLHNGILLVKNVYKTVKVLNFPSKLLCILYNSNLCIILFFFQVTQHHWTLRNMGPLSPAILDPQEHWTLRNIGPSETLDPQKHWTLKNIGYSSVE